ncbi:hypothetical protein QVD17_23168 [Tagetes erecta]|uniref:EF-hand domain-containing protein n=1 Tax=Tagetes erecta TaxID=13708 RepID=A0AAD8KDQ8_TARER|nr:hypothetical protein QVD17_23168 [Tagetes erecta]
MSSLSYNDLYRLFKMLDQDMDGVISTDELYQLLDTMKVSSRVNELHCLTGKTKLTFPEFLELYGILSKDGESESEKDLFKAFEVFDQNRDGLISDEELEEALSRLGLCDKTAGNMNVKLMIKAYDANCDGYLDFHEFKKMMA